MTKFRNLIRKCPLKIHLTIWWEWNHKSKKKKLKEQLEEIQRLRALIRKRDGEIAVKKYIQKETARAEMEAEK